MRTQKEIMSHLEVLHSQVNVIIRAKAEMTICEHIQAAEDELLKLSGKILALTWVYEGKPLK